MHLTPKDQIVLLSGLNAGEERRARLWSLPELGENVRRLAEAGLIDENGLRPAGLEAARSLRYITLDDLLAEHLAEDPSVHPAAD